MLVLQASLWCFFSLHEGLSWETGLPVSWTSQSIKFLFAQIFQEFDLKAVFLEVLLSWWLEDSWTMTIFSMLGTKGRATVQLWKLWGRQIGWQISVEKHASSWNVVQTSLALRWCWINVQRIALSWQRLNTVSRWFQTEVGLECCILGSSGFSSRRNPKYTVLLTQGAAQALHTQAYKISICQGVWEKKIILYCVVEP